MLSVKRKDRERKTVVLRKSGSNNQQTSTSARDSLKRKSKLPKITMARDGAGQLFSSGIVIDIPIDSSNTSKAKGHNRGLSLDSEGTEVRKYIKQGSALCPAVED